MTQEISSADRDHIKLARALEPLLFSEGWRIYSALIEGHLKLKESQLLQVTSGRDEDMQIKGAILAMRLCLSLPRSIVDEASNILHNAGSAPGVDEL